MDARPISPSADLKIVPRLGHSLFVVISAALLLGVGYGMCRIKPEILLVASTAIAAITGRYLGVSWKEMHSGMMQSILRGLPAMLIVVVVGALIASWMASGIIPMIIFHGLGLISAKLFLVSACLATGLVSLLTGTGYGTIGTVGVAFMGIAHGLGIPAGPAAGALVSGAYLGDKISPFAANANLAVAASQSNIYDHIRHSLWTTVPAFLLGLVVYAFIGWHTQGQGHAAAGDENLREAISGHFTFSVWLLLPPVVTLYAMARNKPVIPGMLASAAVAVVLAVWIQHVSWIDAINSLVTGYAPRTGIASLDKLLAQGGMQSMMSVTLIAFCAFAFSGVMQKAGLLEPLLVRLHRFAHTPGRLIAATGASCIAVELMTGAAFLSILIPGELFAPAYRRMNLAAKNLSRAIGDCGIVGVPLIPWSIAGAFMSAATGVSVTSYAPWAIFCYAGMAAAVISGFAGWKIAPRKTDDETQPGS